MRYILLILLITSTKSIAQKFAVIENNEVNAIYFDNSNPNSFIGVLMNNLSLIPEMVILNDFQGVYDEYSLKEIEVNPASMLSFSVRPKLRIYRAFSEDTMDIIKTHQSLQAYLDSLQPDNDYEMLFQMNRNLLEQYWNHAQVNSPVRIISSYYFDIRMPKALIIEDLGDVRWVHFIKEGQNGKNFISLSLTDLQLKETECFVFWQILDAQKSTEIKTLYKDILLDQTHTQDFKAWKAGQAQLFWTIDNALSYSEASFCSQRTVPTDPLSGFGQFENFHFILPFNKELIPIDEEKFKQQNGVPISIYRYETEDSLVIIKTKQGYRSYLDSMAADYNNEELLRINPNNFMTWWKQTNLNDTVRGPKEELTLWRDAANSQIAISYTLHDRRFHKKKSNVLDAILYSEKSANKYCIWQYATLYGGLEPFDNYLKSLKINTKYASKWNALLSVKTKKVSYDSIQKSLQLINSSTIF